MAIPETPSQTPRTFDSLAYLRDVYDQTTPSLGYSARNTEEHAKWERRLRQKVVELIGGFPRHKEPLAPEIVEEVEFPDYIRQRVIFNTRPKMSIPAYLLLPKAAPKQIPGIVCLPGHGPGKDTIVGYDDDGNPREEIGGYQNDFAIQAARNGYAALAVEQLAFGERNAEEERNRGCAVPTTNAFMLGLTMVGLRVWDAMRAVDYLISRDDVDSNRIGVMGISGGGTTSLWTAAIDTRIKAAMVSGYMCTFKDSIMAMPHCVCNFVPGIVQYAEMYDIAALIAPRGLFVESGTKDGIFPLPAVDEAMEKARRAWDVLGAPEKIDREVFEGEHSFHGVKGFEFLAKYL